MCEETDSMLVLVFVKKLLVADLEGLMLGINKFVG